MVGVSVLESHFKMKIRCCKFSIGFMLIYVCCVRRYKWSVFYFPSLLYIIHFVFIKRICVVVYVT